MQQDLAVPPSRDALVRSRTLLINHVRGIVKSFGHRLKKCAAEAFHKLPVPDEVETIVRPLLETIETISHKITVLEREDDRLAREAYRESQLLTQVPGVGNLTALTYMLTIQNPARFAKSRMVGAYLGLTPSRRQSGETEEKRRITKEGDGDTRRLLVQCVHVILRKTSPDTDLKRHGLKIARPGSKLSKPAAIIAVARKLAVLLHALWTSAEVYEPLRSQRTREPEKMTPSATPMTPAPSPA